MKLKIVFILILCHQFIIAQLTDDFSDNDFSNNPSWSGDVEKFDIADGQLHLNDETASSPSVLFTAASTQGLTTWEFKVFLDFNPSSSNYAKVYLNASSSDLDGSLNGYYVRIGGVSGDVDDFSLFKQSGSSSENIIDGVDGLAAGETVSANVRVTRDESGNWELLVDKDLSGSYESQGTVLDDEFVSGAFLGVWCKYSATRSDKFYFDDFLVDPIYEDNEAPTLLNVVVLGPNELQLNFSEELDLNTAQNIENYNVDGFGSPELAILNVENPSEVILTFENSFPLNVEQTITISNLKDLSGNTMSNVSETFVFAVAEYRSVVINEIMADEKPVVGLPESEFVELYNTTNAALDLSGWVFADATDLKSIPDGSVIEANGYLILCPSANIDLWEGYNNVVGFSLPSLNNAADALSLFNGFGDLIDFVNYSDDWYGDEARSGGGYSLELLDANYPCQGASSWAASRAPQGGTPGEKNSQDAVPFDDVKPDLLSVTLSGLDTLLLNFSESIDEGSLANTTFNIEPNLNISEALYNSNTTSLTLFLAQPVQNGTAYTVTVSGLNDCAGNSIGMFNQANFGLGQLGAEGDIVINEILANPITGGVDYIELYNRSDKFIDLANFSIAHENSSVRDSIVDVKEIAPNGYLLFPDSYVVLSKDAAWVMNNYGGCANLNPSDFIEISSFPSYRTDDDLVIVFETDNQDNILDAVRYYDFWHNRLLDNTKGVSLERIDPDGVSNDGNNWGSASINNCSGTPSLKNSQFYMGTSLGEDNVSVYPKSFNPSIAGAVNFTQINYQFDQPDNIMTVKIYDDNGRLIRRIAESEIVGSSGSFKWDGTDDAGEKALIGIYILFIEIFDLDGNVKTFKETVVVAGSFE